MHFSELKRRFTAAAASVALALTAMPMTAFAEAGGDEFEDEELVVITEPTTEEPTTEPETEAESRQGLSSVTVVHTAEITEEDYEPTEWWKADLTEYDDLSLVTYETVDNTAAAEAVVIAEGHDDSIVSNSPTASAVSSTDAGTFAFTTYGWGHCVGLSQNGANFYAKYAGWNYQDILFHYYPGTTLKNTGTAETEVVTVQGVPGNVLQQVAEIVNVEIGPSFEPECIKAQAVAIYTYMKYHNNDAHDLKGKPDPSQKIVDLCASVLGEALYYKDNYCLTMFYASCGGITANCYDIFSADMPYLRSVSSDYDSQYDPHWGDVTYYTVDEVRSRIQEAYNITLSDNPKNWIQIIEGNGGYVNSVVIDGQITVRGYPFSHVMGLKSPKFTYICSAGGGDSTPVAEAAPEEPAAEAEVVPTEQQDVAETVPAEEQNDAAEMTAPPAPDFQQAAEEEIPAPDIIG